MSSNVINYNTGRDIVKRNNMKRNAYKDYDAYDKERRRRAKQKKARQIAKRKLLLTIASVILIIIGCIVFGSIFSSAHVDETNKEVKFFKSIEVQEDDTLWEIAQAHISNAHYDSVRDYVDELKEINGLTSDTIHEGRHLIIVYYE